MLKELESKLRENHAAWTEDRLWNAFAATAPGKVKGRSQAGRFADLVSLVRFALERQPILAPFAESVSERFNEWLAGKQAGNQSGSGVPPLGSENKLSRPVSVFSSEQLAWLNLIRDHIATSLSIDPEDLELSPFNQRGGLGKAHQLFGEQLPNPRPKISIDYGYKAPTQCRIRKANRILHCRSDAETRVGRVFAARGRRRN